MHFRKMKVEQMTKRAIFFFLFLLVFACHHRIIGPVASIDPPFWLPEGKTKLIQPGNLLLTFNEVAADNRCPLNVDCITGGQADVVLSFEAPSFESTELQLIIGPYIFAEDSLAHPFADTLGYRIKLMQLDPHPDVEVEQPLVTYRALLRVSEL